MPTATTSDQSASPPIFAATYALAVLAQLPLLLRYISDLNARPHYGLWMVGIIAVAVIAVAQWPWKQANIHRATIKSILLACAAILCGIAGGLLGEPWFAACSAFLLIASYLSATVDRSGRHSVGYAALPLLAFLRPPLNWDLCLNGRLQEYAAELASRFMHIVGPALVHNRTDSAFQFANRDAFSNADSLFGVGSLYTLIFIALVYVAVNRRNLFQTILLLISCLLWSVILNTIYLTLLPVLNYFLEIETAMGSVSHNVWRWLALLGTGLMVLSTAAFTNFAFNPVDPEIGRSYEFGRFITAVWNNLLAGRPFVNDMGQVVGRAAPRITTRPPNMMFTWVMAGILVVAGVMPLVLGTSFVSVSGHQNVSLTQADMPEALDDWVVMGNTFQVQAFDGTSVHGLERETWNYQSPDMGATCSIAEPFNMWYELPAFYALKGWKLTGRQAVSPQDPTDPWSYVVADMSSNTGEMQRVLFCYFDSAGNPIQPPSGGRISGSLAAASADTKDILYQVSVVHLHFNELSQDKLESLDNLFLKFRQAARDRMLRGGVTTTSAAAPEANADSLAP